MAPRGLTETEKQQQKALLLNHGEKLIFRYGISKVSVDDIVKEAGVAKGTFYNFFSSKDDFLYELIFQIHEAGFAEIHQILEEISKAPSSEKRTQIKQFFLRLYKSPQQKFFLDEHDEIQRFLARYSKETLAKLEAMENANYLQLFSKLGIKSGKKPEIVQNFVHIIYFGGAHKDVLVTDYVDETIEMMLEGLLNYLEV